MGASFDHRRRSGKNIARCAVVSCLPFTNQGKGIPAHLWSAAGVEFIDENGGGLGVKLRKPWRRKTEIGVKKLKASRREP